MRFSFVRMFLKNFRVSMTTTLDTSCSENFILFYFILTNLFGSTYYNISSLSRNKNNRLYTNNWIAILYRYIYIYIFSE
jgi:hypothetical protein